MALFVPDVEFTIALVFIEYLRNCFPNVRYRVSFHMIYPGKKTWMILGPIYPIER